MGIGWEFARYVASGLGRRATREQLLALQARRLRRVVRHAATRVPYYRRLFRRHGIDPSSIRTPADLARVPITTKEDLRALPPEETLAEGVDPSRLVTFATGGYSGVRFRVRVSECELLLAAFYILRSERLIGIRAGDRLACVRYPRPGFRRRRPVSRRLLDALGIYRRLEVDCTLSDEEIERRLVRFGADVVTGYAGAVERLADHLARSGRGTLRPRLLCIGGEEISVPGRRRIEKAFGVRVFDRYASHEFDVIAWQCKQTGSLHVSDDSLVLEVLSDGQPVAPGERGEVVVTSLYRFAMPFIRYRLGDIVTRHEAPCRCGAPFSVVSTVEGRSVDYFPLAGGRLLHPLELVVPITRAAPWLRRIRLVQERRDRIVAHVEADGAPPPKSELRRLEAEAASVLGPGVEIEVLLVPEIATPRDRKFRPYISLVEPAPP